ncbi:MAG: response regulator transcription factor [Clostridia bacterium]|nr:response regulator transcription factor [Clostridia bacterium]
MNYAFAVVDDEKKQTEVVKTMLEKYCAENAIEASIAVFSSGTELLKNYAAVYDAIFLDIEMGAVDGIETAKAIRRKDNQTAIIFITRLARFAVKGYEVSALYFLLKPLEYTSFASRMKKIVKYIDGNRTNYIVLSIGNGCVKVLEDKIYYIEAYGHCIVYHTDQGEFTQWEPLKAVEKKLGKGKFFYSDRSHLVNLRYVTDTSSDSVTVNQTLLPISRYKRKSFLEAITVYLGEKE